VTVWEDEAGHLEVAYRGQTLAWEEIRREERGRADAAKPGPTVRAAPRARFELAPPLRPKRSAFGSAGLRSGANSKRTNPPDQKGTFLTR